ncbi:MAG: hypothetical protein ACRCVV_21830 [Shewanella sp.]
MRYINKLLDYTKIPEKGHIHLFTGNRVIMPNGALVMGGGNALSCALALPTVPLLFGRKKADQVKDLNTYLLFHPHPKQYFGGIGVMFTKNHFKDPSDLANVVKAIEALKTLATDEPELTFHLPYPGCGLGGLTREQLDSHVEALPDNVLVYVA